MNADKLNGYFRMISTFILFVMRPAAAVAITKYMYPLLAIQIKYKWWFVTNDDVVNIGLSMLIATTYHLAHDFVCHILFRKSSHNHGLWNLDANSSLEEPHSGIDLFLLRGTILWHVGNVPYIVLQQLWIWNCDDNAILHATRRERFWRARRLRMVIVTRIDMTVTTSSTIEDNRANG